MSRQQLLLAKIESVYDTDPTPDDSNAIQTIDLSVERYAGDRISRELDRHLLGGMEQINVNPQTIIAFATEVASSGAAGTAPPVGVLLRACGFEEDITAATDAQYQLPDDQSTLLDGDSITCWTYLDQAGFVQKTTGVRGMGLTMTMSRGQIPRFNFSDLIGTYNRPAAGSMPTGIDWSAWRDPLPFTNANVPTLTLDSVSACVESFELNFGLEGGRRNLPGCQSTRITNYATTGQIKIEAPAIGTKDWYAKAEAHDGTSLVALSLQIGNDAGDIVTVAASSVQIVNITEDEMEEGDTAFVLDLSFVDRPIITFK